MSALFLAQAAPPGASGSAALMQFLVIGLLFAGMWFLLIAPQRKKQKEHQKMIGELKPGDEILTAGGIYGTITNVKEDRFTVKLGDNTRVEVNKSFVQDRIKA